MPVISDMGHPFTEPDNSNNDSDLITALQADGAFARAVPDGYLDDAQAEGEAIAHEGQYHITDAGVTAVQTLSLDDVESLLNTLENRYSDRRDSASGWFQRERFQARCEAIQEVRAEIRALVPAAGETSV